MRTNFPGRRYKCLLCDNYDLCGVCYDIEAESQNHKNDHPMQCILTEAAYGLNNEDYNTKNCIEIWDFRDLLCR